MKEIGILVLIVLAIGVIIWLIWLLKPYFIKHDTTILFTGGLGSGKTCNATITGQILIRKMRIKVWIYNFKAKYIINKIRKIKNVLRLKKYNRLLKQNKDEQAEKYKNKKPLLEPLKLKKRPLLYSNYPIHFRTNILGFKREWATKLTAEHICLLKEINEYSVIIIDEFPQFISQFEWDVELVQKNCNEFITYYRHYIGGYAIFTAQSEDEIECHFRRKLNQGIWCFNFKIWPCSFIPIFFTVRMCDFIISENIQTMSTTYIEENTRLHFGFLPRKVYDTRCYSIRYERVKHKLITTNKWKKLKTNEVLRLKPYVSPLDTETTQTQLFKMEQDVEKLRRNKDDN